MALDATRIQKPLRKIRKLLRKMSPVPSVEEIHDFRTNSRRVETMLHAFSLDETKEGGRLAKRISKLRKRAGEVRDYDVLTDYLSGIPHIDSEAECSVRLLEHLGARREKQAHRFHEVRQQHVSRLRKQLKRISRKVGKVVPANRDGRGNGNTLSATVTASALTTLFELREPARLGRANLHAYRLKVKELRNLLQMAPNANQQQFISRLGEVKDAIGEWHDWEVLVAIAGDVLDHGNRCQMLNDLRQTAAAKYRNALALALKMRREFLHVRPGHRKKPSNGQIGLPAEPVWSATAALAA
jgi:CHAD domain-containing protein